MANRFLVKKSPRKSSSRLDEATQAEIVKRLYRGQTLFRICRELDIDRADVDLSQRFDSKFATALRFAVEALGDTQAEQALEVLLGVPDSGPLDERQFMLRKAKEIAWHLRWMSDRTGQIYQRRKSKEAAKRQKQRFVSNVPEKE